MTEPVTVYGEAVVHLLSAVRPSPGLALGRVDLTVGGPGAAVSLQLAKLGHPPRFIGVTGDDTAGAFLRGELRRAGVDCTALATLGRTTHVMAVVDGGEVALAADPGASWRSGPWYRQPPSPAGDAYITGFPELVPAIRSLGRRGHRMTVDIGFVPLLAQPAKLLEHVAAVAPATGVCVVSGATLDTRTRDAIARICFDNGVAVVLTTLAGEGVLVSTPQASRHLPGRPVTIVDVLCAGDAFVAGYLCAVREGSDPFAAAEFGQAVAATKIGLFGRFPDRAEVDGA
jgi:sugar/nucleoside kinase (ribokinase family)